MNIEFNKETCNYQFNLDHQTIWTLKRSLENRLTEVSKVLSYCDEDLKPYLSLEIDTIRNLLYDINSII